MDGLYQVNQQNVVTVILVYIQVVKDTVVVILGQMQIYILMSAVISVIVLMNSIGHNHLNLH